jgi:flagellar biosynthesis/type III secretory pathway chaperone
MLDQNLFTSLNKALQYENRVYAGLLDLAEKKTEYLVKNDTNSLSHITSEEIKLAEQAGQLGRVREQYVSKMREVLGKQDASLGEMIDCLPDDQKNALSKSRERLKDTVIRLGVRNGINKRLIDNALEYINFNLELLASPSPETPVYGKSGQEVKSGRVKSMLDIKY